MLSAVCARARSARKVLGRKGVEKERSESIGRSRSLFLSFYPRLSFSFSSPSPLLPPPLSLSPSPARPPPVSSLSLYRRPSRPAALCPSRCRRSLSISSYLSPISVSLPVSSPARPPVFIYLSLPPATVSLFILIDTSLSPLRPAALTAPAPAALRVTRVLLGVGSRQVKTDRDGK